MKISKNTFNILKNFASINQNLKFKPGQVIKTVSPLTNIFAKAVVEEEFPRKFAIYDMNNFLSAVDLLNDPEFEFMDDRVVLHSGNRSLDYFYCDESIEIEGYKKKVMMPSEEVAFLLKAEDFKSLTGAASVLDLEQIAIHANNSAIHLSVLNDDNQLANTFDISLPETSEHDFKGIFKVDNLKLLAGSYDVTMSLQQPVANFKNTALDLEYWITAEVQSRYPDSE